MSFVEEGKELQERSVDLRPLNPQEVLVEIKSAGVCHSDLHLLSGAWDLGEGRKISTTRNGALLPLVPGHEIAGTIKEMGADAELSRFKRGDSVVVYPWIGCGMCRECISGKENLCESGQSFMGFNRDGGYAQYVYVPDVRYLASATDMDMDQSATLACSGLTAYSAIRKCNLTPDSLLFIIGSGGLGTTAIQIAKKMTGARVVVADVNDTKLSLASDLGADDTINSSGKTEKEIVGMLRKLNDGRGADSVIDFVGLPLTSSLGFRSLGYEGRLILVGLGGGTVSYSLPMFPLLGARIIGNFTGSIPEFNELVTLARRKVIQPVVTEKYELVEANTALRRLEKGEIAGRAVLHPWA